MNNHKEVTIDRKFIASIKDREKAIEFIVGKGVDLKAIGIRAKALGYVIDNVDSKAIATKNLLVLETNDVIQCITNTSFKMAINATDLFRDTKFTSIDLTNINTTGVKNMKTMFYNSNARKIKLSSVDTGNVMNMERMFAYSKAESLDLKSFDTHNVMSMQGMFMGSQAEDLDLSNFDTSNVVMMHLMFSDCKSKRIDISNFVSDSILGEQLIEDMFKNCNADIIVKDSLLKEQCRV